MSRILKICACKECVYKRLGPVYSPIYSFLGSSQSGSSFLSFRVHLRDSSVSVFI